MASAASGSLRGESDEELLRAAMDLRCDPAAEEISLPCRPEAAAVSRRLTRLQLHHRWMLSPQLTDDATLLVSELVTNVLQHAGSRTFGLRFRRRRGWVRAEVRDPSRALPCLLQPLGPLDNNGRGLCLVNEIADRWGVDLLPLGKSTWCELRATAR
jgi:anti-sigma regulatory factor (Ser/Thr protein kinase)